MSDAPDGPVVLERDPIPYLGVRRTVAANDLGDLADEIPGLLRALSAAGVPPTGPPFFRYEVLDGSGRLTVTAGVPVPAETSVDGVAVDGAAAGALPGGDWAVLRHTGHPDSLAGAAARLLAWADARGLAFDVTTGADGERWAGRVEFYETDPDAEPDPARWTTQLAFLLAPGQL